MWLSAESVAGRVGVRSERANRIIESNPMGKYQIGDHVKFEVVDGRSGEAEWLWLSVHRSDDENGIVFGRLDSQPIVMTDMKFGQELAVSYDNIREHHRFN